MAKKPITHAERQRIAGEAQVSYTTVLRWYRGQPIQPISRVRIESAVERLASTRGRAGS